MTRTEIPFPYFCTGQESKSESVFVPETGKVIKLLIPAVIISLRNKSNVLSTFFLLLLFILTDSDSDSDWKPNDYIVQCRRTEIWICECKQALSEMNAVLTRSPLKLGGSLKKSAVRSSERCTSLNRLNVILLLAALTRKPSRICWLSRRSVSTKLWLPSGFHTGLICVHKRYIQIKSENERLGNSPVKSYDVIYFYVAFTALFTKPPAP